MISKSMQDKINKEIEEIWASIFASNNMANTFNIDSDNSITIEDINILIEQCRPEYATLLNDSMEYGKIFEIVNTSPDQYYCKKLLLMNPTYYKDIEDILYREGINMRVYRNGKELIILNKIQNLLESRK